MNDLKDTIQVGLANGTAIGVSLSEINEALSLVATGTYKSVRKKRKGVHSKNASRGQNAFKQPYRGQGRN